MLPIVAFSLCLAIHAPPQVPSVDAAVEALAREILAATDAPSPKERRAAALAIAKRREVTVALARLAIDNALRFEPAAPGVHVERAPIWADGKIEDTELVVYVPKGYDPKTPSPLIEVFHGTGGRGQDEAPLWRATCDELGMLLVAPSEAGANEGYAFSKRERDAALGALRWMMRHYHVDAGRVFASGTSRGGHLTWDVAVRHPDRFAAIAPLIGSPRFQLVRNQNNLRYLENLVETPIRDLQGSKDDPALVESVHEAFAKLAKLQAKDAKLVEFEDRGHDYDFAAVNWVEFLGRGRRNALREKIVLAAADLDEARAFWVEIERFTKDVAENPRLSVEQATWAKLDAAGQRRWCEDQVEKQTARLEIAMTARGRFEANGKGVAGLRLLLTPEMFEADKPLEVELNGRTTKKKVAPDTKVLLAEFVERLDRTFLPVAALDVP